MTTRQRNLILLWIFIVSSIGLLAYLESTDSKYFHPVALCMIIIGSILSNLQDLSHYRGYGADGKNLFTFIEEHFFIKIWSILYCATLLPFIIYKLATEGLESGHNGLLFFFGLISLLGPPLVVSEIERYRSFK